MTVRVTRRAILASSLTTLAGCSVLPGEPLPDSGENPAFGEVNQIGDLELSSPAILESGRIPNRYGHFFRDVNPPLDIHGVPQTGRALVLILDGPDAPGGEFTHWLVWNIPPDIRHIPEAWNPPDSVVQGGNSYGNIEYGYVGPDPPNKQTYRFKLFALDTTLTLPQGARKRTLGTAMTGHILAQTQLTAWYDFHSVAHDSIRN